MSHLYGLRKISLVTYSMSNISILDIYVIPGNSDQSNNLNIAFVPALLFEMNVCTFFFIILKADFNYSTSFALSWANEVTTGT